MGLLNVKKLCRGSVLAVHNNFNQLVAKVRRFKIKGITPRKLFRKKIQTIAEDEIQASANQMIPQESSCKDTQTLPRKSCQEDIQTITKVEVQVSSTQVISQKSSCKDTETSAKDNGQAEETKSTLKDNVSAPFEIRSATKDQAEEETFLVEYEKCVHWKLNGDEDVLNITNFERACLQSFNQQEGCETVLVCEQEGVGDILMEKKLLGEGSFGTVRTGQFIKRQDESDSSFHCTKVAVKCISFSKYAARCKHRSNWESDLRSLVETEMKAMILCLGHRSIVQVKFAVFGNDEFLCGLEFASKGDLATYLEENGKVTERRARRWFRDIAEALLFCHSKGIVHFDIKAENILIDAQENVKLADFGLASIAEDPTNANQYTLFDYWKGTFHYLAPEMASGRVSDTRLCDVWSLGVLLYFMVAGFHPFDDEDALYRAWDGYPIRFPVGFPLGPRFVIRRSLVVDAWKRISMNSVVSHKWVKEESAA